MASVQEHVWDAVPVKRCSKCREFKPLDREHWYPRKDSRDGFRGRCRLCEIEAARLRKEADPEAFRAKRRALYAKWKQDPVWLAKRLEASRDANRQRRIRAHTDAEVRATIQAATRRHYERLRADPVRWENMLQDRRIRESIKRREEGLAFVPQRTNGGGKNVKNRRHMLDAEPFRSWLLLKMGGGSPGELAPLVDLDERTIRGIINKEAYHERVGIDIVDRALTREGSAHLHDLYPELSEDAA